MLPMVEVYPDGEDERVPDDDWILRAHDEGWVALTKDYSIIRDHVDTLAETTLRVFSLNNANLTGPQMAERFDLHLNRIIQRAASFEKHLVTDPAELPDHQRPFVEAHLERVRQRIEAHAAETGHSTRAPGGRA